MSLFACDCEDMNYEDIVALYKQAVHQIKTLKDLNSNLRDKNHKLKDNELIYRDHIQSQHIKMRQLQIKTEDLKRDQDFSSCFIYSSLLVYVFAIVLIKIMSL